MKFREKILIITASFIIVFTAIILFLILPLREDIIQVNQQIEDRRIVYEINKRRSKNLASFQKDIEEIQLQNDILKNMFINESHKLALVIRKP